jgi:hypothetical protein
MPDEIENETFEHALTVLIEQYNEDSITEIKIAEALVNKAKELQGGRDAINEAGTDIEIAELEDTIDDSLGGD